MTIMRYFIFTGVLLVGLNNLASADVITDWNEQAVASGYAAKISPTYNARNIAIVHLAMFEALNSIEPRFAPYRKRFPVESGTAPEAAAAAAAHYLLVRMYPDQVKQLETVFHGSLRAVADGLAKTAGVRLGEQAAMAVLAERSTDGADRVGR
jgi:hypothetical protein